MRLAECFPDQVLKLCKVLCASSYGHFIARIEFCSQCHILLLGALIKILNNILECHKLIIELFNMFSNVLRCDTEIMFLEIALNHVLSS